jgi:hypothetical protein
LFPDNPKKEHRLSFAWKAVAALSLAAPVFGQYTGPAILSRGEAPAAMAAPEIRFRPFVEANMVYDTGLANVGVNDQGQLATAASLGTSIVWGLSGAHSWKHVRLGLDYRGGFTHYTEQSSYDSFDHSLMLAVTNHITRHITVNLHETAGLMTRDFGLLDLPQTVPFDPSTAFIPTTDYYDNRTYYLNSHADLVVQKSARMSFYFSGDSFLTRRHSSALDGINGYMARGDVQYRLSRRTTIGANYTYMSYRFTRATGGTDIHGVSGTYSLRVSRWTEISGYAGFMRAESKFVQVIPIDPAIAALLGISSAAQIVHKISTIPNLSGRISRTFRTGVVYAAGAHTIIPGNGLFDTSYASTVAGGYSYTGLRRWSSGIHADYVRASSVGLIGGRYDGAGAGLSLSRQIGRGFHFVTSYTLRRYGSPDYAKYNRTIYDARVGIGFSPGDVPLRIW